MDPKQAALVTALRPAIESLIVQASEDPGSMEQIAQNHSKVIQVTTLLLQVTNLNVAGLKLCNIKNYEHDETRLKL